MMSSQKSRHANARINVDSNLNMNMTRNDRMLSWCWRGALFLKQDSIVCKVCCPQDFVTIILRFLFNESALDKVWIIS